MRELQVAPSDRTRLGRVDGARRLCEADAEAGPHGRGTKTAHRFEAGRRPCGGLREAGRVREPGVWRRSDDREQDPREDAGHGEGVPERPVRGETEVRHDAALLERAAGETKAVLGRTRDRKASFNKVRWSCGARPKGSRCAAARGETKGTPRFYAVCGVVVRGGR